MASQLTWNDLPMLVGIATLGYMLSKLTVFIVEGQFDEVLRRRKMQEEIDRMNGHYVVCGVGRVGFIGRLGDGIEPADRPPVDPPRQGHGRREHGEDHAALG